MSAIIRYPQMAIWPFNDVNFRRTYELCNSFKDIVKNSTTTWIKNKYILLYYLKERKQLLKCPQVVEMPRAK